MQVPKCRTKDKFAVSDSCLSHQIPTHQRCSKYKLMITMLHAEDGPVRESGPECPKSHKLQGLPLGPPPIMGKPYNFWLIWHVAGAL